MMKKHRNDVIEHMSEGGNRMMEHKRGVENDKKKWKC